MQPDLADIQSIADALRAEIDRLDSLLRIANGAGDRLLYSRADTKRFEDNGATGSIADTYQAILTDVAREFGIDCVILATWDAKSRAWRNGHGSLAAGTSVDVTGLLSKVLREKQRDRLLQNEDQAYWELDPPVKLGESLFLKSCRARALPALPRPNGLPMKAAGLLVCLFRRPVEREKSWQRIIDEVSAVLARETYRFLRPYLGDRRIAEGNYDLKQFFQQCERPAAFLFADLRNFTAITEALRVVQKDQRFQDRLADRGPELSIQRLLKEYHTLMSRILRDNVRILEFTGDGVFAVFCNLLDEHPSEDTRQRDCLKALCSAVQMKIAFRELRSRWHNQWMDLYRREYNEELDLEMGIGINAGPATFTVFGAADYTRFSVIGDHVNFAKRLCDAAARPDPAKPDRRTPNILLSQTSYSLIKEFLHHGGGGDPQRFVGLRRRFKGKSGWYMVYGLGGSDDALASAILTGNCKWLFKRDPHQHYFCQRQTDKEGEREFICDCGFQGDAFDLPGDQRGRAILRLL